MMKPEAASALQNIRVVLARPSHPGNIGSAARAMKTMGLTRLTLVLPGCDGRASTTRIFCSAEAASGFIIGKITLKCRALPNPKSVSGFFVH
jgi:tRNA C32,U32 (ribose-2'-O)-methylase TrmJ